MIVLNESNFAEETREGLVLVDFYTEWCGPCRVLAPTLEQIERVKVVKVDAEECPNLSVQFRISGVPCLVFMRDGVEVDRITGLVAKDVIQQKVDGLQCTNSLSA